MNAIIVDDEKLARKELTSLLQNYNSIEVVGEAADLEEARGLLKDKEIDIVFLDVQLHGETGFEIVDEIPEKTSIIFVTAYDEYAIRAFEVNALDYLTKPIYPKRLEKTIARILDNSEKEKRIRENENFQKEDHLFLTINEKSRFVKIDSISIISTAGDYTEVITSEGNKALTSTSMREWEKKLPESQFCRIHRSSIINLSHVNYLEDWFNKSYKVYMKNFEKPLIMSRRYAADIKKRLRV